MPLELKTARLLLRELEVTDTSFIVELLNSPGWLQNIGDRGVHTLSDAENYIRDRVTKSYTLHGFGLWKVIVDEKPAGLCGFVKREGLEYPDLGFAFLPQYNGKGYASEAALACMNWMKEHRLYSVIQGITLPANIASIRVLEKAGLQFEKNIRLPGDPETLMLFSIRL